MTEPLCSYEIYADIFKGDNFATYYQSIQQNIRNTWGVAGRENVNMAKLMNAGKGSTSAYHGAISTV